VNFVNEQDIIFLQVSQYSSQVAGAFDGWAGAYFYTYSKVSSDNVCKGGFAKTRRAIDEDVVQRLLSFLRRRDRYFEVFLDFILPNEIRQAPGTKVGVKRSVIVAWFWRYHTCRWCFIFRHQSDYIICID
jgi:hypothetical protein